jgi:hypothetical protein
LKKTQKTAKHFLNYTNISSGTKLIHLKMWLTIKFHNFLRSTSSILIVSTSETIYKIWISNLKTSHEFFNDKMISYQKIVNYKVLLHFKTYNFYIGGFFIRVSLKNSNFKIQTYFCMTKWFQTKTLSTTKFHNSSIPTTFMLVVFSFEVVFKIQILNFINSDVVFVDKMTSNEKVANYKIL